ncbi:hypothetical protein, partial [Nocardioides malaquae]|uniref:hypothetical protein n=1 Tax=Nocardioides malaquae TaxID=2773426 RepID=UPI001D0D3846
FPIELPFSIQGPTKPINRVSCPAITNQVGAKQKVSNPWLNRKSSQVRFPASAYVLAPHLPEPKLNIPHGLKT